MSSLKDLASLIMIPSLYKDGRLDTVKPLGNSIIHPDATGNNDGTDGSTPAEGNFTFSRGSNLAATRVDVNGLIEKGRENLLLQSNQFDTTWATYLSSVTGNQTGYDGSSDAWLLTKSGVDGFVRQFVSVSGLYTFSVYAKAGSLNFCRVYMASSVASVAAYVDLTDGSVGTLLNSPIDVVTQSVGGGWYRISITHNDSGMNNFRIYPAQADNDASGTSGSIYIQDAQLEQGLVATDYIETGTSAAQSGILEDMPRLDYSGSCPSLLLEPQRTNSVLHSEYYAGYPQTRITLTHNAATSPEGVDNATKMVETTDTGLHFLSLNGSVTSSSNAAFSIFAKQGENQFLQVLFGTGQTSPEAYANVDLSNGTYNDYNMVSFDTEDYGNGWYRIFGVINPLATSLGFYIASVQSKTAARAETYTGDGTSGFYLYGGQVESGSSYPTSYIPTYGTSQTRSKENSYKASISDLIGQEQGTLFAEVDISHLDGTTARDLFFLSNTDNVSDDWIGIGFSGVGSNTLRGRIVDSGSLKFDQYGTISSTGRYKIALAYENGNGAFYVNGVSFGTNYVNTNFSLTLDRIFNAPVGFSSQFADDVKQLLVFPTRLTNAELAALTTI